MVFLGVYYTLLDIGELGAEGLMLTLYLFRHQRERCGLFYAYGALAYDPLLSEKAPRKVLPSHLTPPAIKYSLIFLKSDLETSL